jgi:hypothetical protein
VSRERQLDLDVPVELALAAEEVLHRALLEFLARAEGQASTYVLFAAFIHAARAEAERTKVSLIEHMLGAPSRIPPDERATVRAQVAAEYSAVRRLVRDEP